MNCFSATDILLDQVELIGTIRSFDETAREALHAKVERVAKLEREMAVLRRRLESLQPAD